MMKSAVSQPARPRLTRLCNSRGTIKMAYGVSAASPNRRRHHAVVRTTAKASGTTPRRPSPTSASMYPLWSELTESSPMPRNATNRPPTPKPYPVHGWSSHDCTAASQ